MMKDVHESQTKALSADVSDYHLSSFLSVHKLSNVPIELNWKFRLIIAWLKNTRSCSIEYFEVFVTFTIY